MNKKKGNFIEEHIEKAVLGLAGILSAFLLFKFVITSPNVFPSGGRKLSAGQIDIKIYDEAQELKKRLSGDSISALVYEPNVNIFAAKMDEAMKIDSSILWPLPSAVEMKIEKKYRIPEIGGITNVSAEHIRAAAYVPTREITMENAKEKESYEADDVDFVTVQASFDRGKLAEAFEASFAGKDLPEAWRDERIAKPVFAAVELQRQKMGEDGSWGEWQNIERARIDPQREDFKIIENVNDLPSGSVMVRMLRLSEAKTQASLLQPMPYQIASMEEEWYPPALHKKFLKNKADREAAERREQMEAQRELQDQQRETGRPTREQRRPKPGAGPGGGADDYMKMMMGGEGGGGGGARPTTRIRTRTEPAVRPEQPARAKPDLEKEIYDEMNRIMLTDKDVSKLMEEIVLWAYDDTVEPGKTYRYRIRAGAFNPVAGKGEVEEQDAAYANKVILWGKYSDATELTTIPQRIYFFPVAVQEAAKQVEVQVYKYALGYWYGEQFMVKRGDMIGKEVKLEQTKEKSKSAKPAGGATDNTKGQTGNEDLTLPEVIDYTTEAMVVDVVAASGWSGDKNLTSDTYYDMLYSFDGSNIGRMAAKLMLWPEELRAKYTEIRVLERKPKLAFREWSASQVIGGRTIRGGPTRRPGTRGMEEGMTYEEMMMMGMPGGN